MTTSSQGANPTTRRASRNAWHVTDYLRVLYKRRWTAGAAFLVVFLSGAIGSLRTMPVYEATTQILIEQEARRATTLNTVLDNEFSSEEDYLPTELRILRSRGLARRTVDSLGLPKPVVQPQAEPSFSVSGAIDAATGALWGLAGQAVGAPQKIEPPAPDETTAQVTQIGEFLGGLSVEPIRNTRIVELSYRSPDPEFAARAANAAARQYIQHSVELRFLASKEANDWLSKQLEDQRRVVQQSEAALQRYREAHGAVALDDRQNVFVQRLADLNGAVTEAKTARIEREAIYSRVLSLRNDRAALDSFPAILGNTFIQELKTEIVALQRQQANLGARYGERHPEMVRATTQLRAAEAKLQMEIDKVVESVHSEFLTAQARERSLVQALESQKGEALSLNRKGIEYAALERDAASNRQLYENLLERTKEAGVSGEFKGTNIQIIDAAEVPREPVLPQTTRDLLRAFLTGCLAAVALAFAFEYLDNRIKSPEEIRTHLGLPFLGLVPTVAENGKPDYTPLLNNGVPPNFSEALKTIRTAVVFSSPDETTKTILVTSTGPHEGKTLVASNLAVALAQAGQRTLIVDCDMRRPRVHEVFDAPQEPGLSNLLIETHAAGVTLRATDIPNLMVLPAGHIPPNPAELLGSRNYRTLLKELSEQFDWVILDAPPVMAVTDASVLAHTAGGVVFVVGAEMTSRATAATALEQLATARARIIGAVLNRVDVGRHSYYYSPYYRKDYAKYYQQSVHRS